jgi:hypothetical protein
VDGALLAASFPHRRRISRMSASSDSGSTARTASAAAIAVKPRSPSPATPSNRFNSSDLATTSSATDRTIRVRIEWRLRWCVHKILQLISEPH